MKQPTESLYGFDVKKHVDAVVEDIRRDLESAMDRALDTDEIWEGIIGDWSEEALAHIVDRLDKVFEARGMDKLHSALFMMAALHYMVRNGRIAFDLNLEGCKGDLEAWFEESEDSFVDGSFVSTSMGGEVSKTRIPPDHYEFEGEEINFYRRPVPKSDEKEPGRNAYLTITAMGDES